MVGLVDANLGDQPAPQSGPQGRVCTSCPRGLEWQFFDAADGHAPEQLDPSCRAYVPGLFWKRPRIKPGAFGCFLSHFMLWHRIVATGQSALVLEDDAVFCDPTIVRPDIAGPDWDLMFVNERMVTWRQRVEGSAARPGPADLPGLMRLAAPQHAQLPGGPGTDGYVLRPAGARGLINAAKRFGFRVGVDWFLVARSAPADLLLQLCPYDMPEILADPEPSLRCGIAASPWVRVPESGAASTIQHQNRESLESYRARLGAGNRAAAIDAPGQDQMPGPTA